MRRFIAGSSFLLVSLWLAACGPAASQAKLLVTTPDPNGYPPPSVAAVTDCIATPEATTDTRKSTLDFSGPCPLAVRNAVECLGRTDDFYVYINRSMPRDGQLVIVVNVEHYKGPGRYTQKGSVSLAASRGGAISTWLQPHATVTISPDSKRVWVEGATMPPLAGTGASGTEHVTGMVTCVPPL